MTASLSPTNWPPPIGVRGDTTIIESFALPLGDGLVLCHPSKGRLVVLNATGKTVWDLLHAGHAHTEIASAFAGHFGLPVAQASADVATVIAMLDEAQTSDLDPPVGTAATPLSSAVLPCSSEPQNNDCGAFRFGNRLVRVLSAVPDVGSDYFSRFRHRAVVETAEADILELSGDPSGGYRLAFCREIVAKAHSLSGLVGRTNELFLNWEHPEVHFLAYFHAAAVRRGSRAILLPGVSGAGKSTLVAYLASRGFTYLSDDLIAMTASDWSLRPLPTCLAIKAGSWPVLQAFYPQIANSPTVRCHGRAVRYVEPMETSGSAGAPSVILFPTYAKDGDAHLGSLTPLRTMTRLLEANTDLDEPVTETKVAEFLRFVGSTPAYEFSYFDLPSAMNAIERLLENKA
jgi:Coenzyme PQQ synthesis protein D (PqqD)